MYVSLLLLTILPTIINGLPTKRSETIISTGKFEERDTSDDNIILSDADIILGDAKRDTSDDNIILSDAIKTDKRGMKRGFVSPYQREIDAANARDVFGEK